MRSSEPYDSTGSAASASWKYVCDVAGGARCAAVAGGASWATTSAPRPLACTTCGGDPFAAGEAPAVTLELVAVPRTVAGEAEVVETRRGGVAVPGTVMDE